MRHAAHLPLDSFELLLALQPLVKLAHAGRTRPCDRKRPVDLLFPIARRGGARARPAELRSAGEVLLLLPLVLRNARLAGISRRFCGIVIHICSTVAGEERRLGEDGDAQQE